MKSYTKYILPIALLIVLSSCESDNSTIETEIKIPVSVISLKEQSISRFIETTGTVYSSKEAVLKSELAGTYRLQRNPATGRPFALGDFVKQNQVLIKLEDKEYENNLQLEGKKLNLEVSQNNLNKQKSLHEKGGVTLTELKNASIEYVNAKYSFENSEIQLAKMSVRAPFDGVIVELPYQTDGVKIELGKDLFKIMKFDRLLLDIKLPEKHLNEVEKNQEVQVTNYNISQDTLTGRISQIAPVIDPETRTFQSVLEINNDRLLLRPGMFIKAAILSEKRNSTIVIPKETVISRQSGKVVFTVENGIASEKSIKTGLENQDNIEVIDGLKINDRLVIAGFETLRNKSKVSVIQ
ncbi:MAG: efflux RND transporter periplasmic adaptor subunit [Cyclobacteriaceae bacterium]